MLTSGGSSPFPSPGLHVCCSSAAGVLCWRSGAARAVCGRGESCTEAASSDEQTRSSSGERRVYVRPRRRALREPGLQVHHQTQINTCQNPLPVDGTRHQE
eukprot:scaffold2254_cov393-Prasinococcus_capsulatus_cf.AAC.4